MVTEMMISIDLSTYKQTVSLYHGSSVWLDTRNTSRWDWNQPNFTSDRYHTTQPATDPTEAREFNVYVLTFVCLHFTLSDTEMVNSLEKLCITRVATINSFNKVLNPRSSCTDNTEFWITHTHTHTHSLSLSLSLSLSHAHSLSLSLSLSFTIQTVLIFMYVYSLPVNCLVGWDCKMHRLLLCRGVRPRS